MHNATLCLLIRHTPSSQVLFGLKKYGFGKGKYNGFGGKLNPGESLIDGAVRELLEESGVQTNPEHLSKYAELEFRFPDVPKEKDWDQIVHVYLVNKWAGEPKETSEMKPEWIDLAGLPYNMMWDADAIWMPYVFDGKYVRAKFVYTPHKKLIDKTLSVTNSPQW